MQNMLTKQSGNCYFFFFLIIIGKLHIHPVSFESIISHSILSCQRKGMSFKLELIGIASSCCNYKPIFHGDHDS
jgi:hypothetical protein